MRIGIDFGTTRTVVAAASQGRYPVASFEIEGGYAEYLPGIAVGAPDLRFGSSAQACIEGSGGIVRSIKRSACQLPHDEVVPELSQLGITALDLLTRYLSFVRSMLVERSSLDIDPEEPLESMVAVPANASSRQRYLTLEAFKRAGFQVLGMVNEPTAAAIEFARRHLGVLGRRSPKRYVVVYDLGGGTFDSAAVSLEGRRFELIASAGISRLGGDDFDELILDLALRELGGSPGQLEGRARLRALEICRAAKETLTPASRRVLIDLTPALPDAELVILDAAGLYAEAQPLIDRTVEKLEQVFAQLVQHGIDPENPRELGAVYLVGGGTAFPGVSRTLRRLYGRKIQLAPQPHAATAVGLALAADADANVYVRESTTRYFGLWREAQGGKEQVFDPILHKNHAADDAGPLVIERAYRPVHPVGHLRFLECGDLGANGQPAGDLTPWRDVFFPYDAALSKAEAEAASLAEQRRGECGDEIVERYTYTAEGAIELEIENRTRGYRRVFELGRLR